ncbi:U11/U12 small nuclear ribonucleoprotein 48 kDa protein-like [Coffea arabica]|uniref:U11/U12 small nuclear ribonucleoprotein 48 kDa protein-like n=1 Tax=Coffea arabica TaxID=13443 RepID=A0ABM4VMZ1_COFAR
MNPPPPFPPFHPPPPPPPPSTTTTTAAPDLPTALSNLTSLLHHTQATLNSLASLLPPSPPSGALIPCPFNTNHRLPPSSIFSHYLSCPSSPSPLDPQALLHSLNYPKTLHSSSENSFTQPLQNPSSTELCFSLENYLNSPQESHFYSNCPGAVVITPCKYDFSSSPPPMLTLPGFLSAECANFTHANGRLDDKGFDVWPIRLLPSEIWAVGNEIEAWVDYPCSYSYRVLRCILRSWKSNLSFLHPWIIANSPKYGVVIDLAMVPHILLLFRFCLKAVTREAIGFLDSLISSKRQDKIHCPVLSKVMMWLGSQLALLYGETDGKFLAIGMFKQCVLDSALSSSFFPVAEISNESAKLNELDDKLEGPVEKCGKNEGNSMLHDTVQSSMIFASQVAAATASLYERSWLEEKIKMLRDTRPLTAYQRAVEHEHISRRADEELLKRSDYRPVIEHDGVLWQQAHSEEPNRAKTREELLAEERDYKRRRMSYRGKKMKRTTTQVMRDIIDEFMDKIKQASGHSFPKDGENTEARAFEGSSLHNSSSDTLKPRKSETKLELIRNEQHVYGASLHSNHAHGSIHSEDKYIEHYKQHKRTSQRHGESLDDNRSTKRSRHDRESYSRSPDRQRSGYHLHGYTRNRGSRDDPESSRAAISRSSDTSRSKSTERKTRRREDDGRNSELRNRDRRKKHNDITSGSEFEDRYNPLESHDDYDDDA